MMIKFLPQGWEDYLYWQQTDRAVLKRINQLIRDIQRDPYSGIGKPEPLRYDFKDGWSRRITDEHRLVYGIEGDTLVILQCRFHYSQKN